MKKIILFWLLGCCCVLSGCAAELTSVKAAISNGNWQDPCCALKEQVTAWAKEKNITV